VPSVSPIALAAALGLVIALSIYEIKTRRGLKQEEMSDPLRYLSLLKQQGATLFATHLLKARTAPDAVKTWRGRLWPRSLAAENTPFGDNTGSDDGSDRSFAGMASKIACGPQQKAVSIDRVRICRVTAMVSPSHSASRTL
jgi:hypothetical protein